MFKQIAILYALLPLIWTDVVVEHSTVFDKKSRSKEGKIDDIGTDTEQKKTSTEKIKKGINDIGTDTEQKKTSTDKIKKGMKVCVGIDLGTTYSSVCIVPQTGAADMDILDIGGGRTTLPSVVRFDPIKMGEKEGVKYVAKTGWDVFLSNLKNPSPHSYLYAFKRYMGIASIEDEPKLEKIHEKVTYLIKEKRNGDQRSIFMEIRDINNNVVKNVSAIDASAYILEHLINIVNDKYGVENIENVIITVPAYFSEVQVQATKTAATIARLKVQRTVNEPVAAAYAYQIRYAQENIESFLVFDFGGGTLDISILEYDSGVLEVVTYSGSNFLGGENINDRLYAHFRGILEKKGVLLDNVELLRLRGFAEKFKISLCNSQNEAIEENGTYTVNTTYSNDFPYLGNKIETFTLSFSEFKRLCAPIIAEINEQLTGKYGVLTKYKNKWEKDKSDIQKVLLVGGSTRVPFIRELLSNLFGKDKVSMELNPDTVVAEGAALYAANMLDWLKDSSVHLIDIVPMNIGICVDTNTFESILDMESAIPASNVKTFTTRQDNQTMVKIKVAQGVRYEYNKNKHLGQFELVLKEPKPKGVPQIEVSVSINKERDISVTAVDKATGTKQQIKFVKKNHELTQKRINELLEDRENNKAADEKMKLKDTKINELESYKDMINATVIKSTSLEESKRTDIFKSITRLEDFIKDAKNPMSGISPEDVSLRHKEFEREIAPFLGKPEQPEEKGAREEL